MVESTTPTTDTTSTTIPAATLPQQPLVTIETPTNNLLDPKKTFNTKNAEGYKGKDKGKEKSPLGFGDALGGFQGIFKALALLFVAMFDPQALAAGGMDGKLSKLLGFDNVDEMNQWRKDAKGDFGKAIKSVHWDKIDTNKVDEDFSQYRHLVKSGNPLLELIGEHESKGDYNKVYGGKHPEIHGKPLSEATINEVLEWQKAYVNKGSPSSAAGKYQIIQDTLKGLVKDMKLTGNEVFDEKMQDKMALKLLDKRGLDEFVSGKISRSKFMDNIAHEWASLPKNMSGVGAYDDDGLNHAGAKAKVVAGTLDALKTTYNANADGIGAEPSKTLTAAVDTTKPIDTTKSVVTSDPKPA